MGGYASDGMLSVRDMTYRSVRSRWTADVSDVNTDVGHAFFAEQSDTYIFQIYCNSSWDLFEHESCHM